MNLINHISPEIQVLMDQAMKAREMAYSPYSKYKVGASLIDSNGIIHTGCNIESADYTLTTHAEMLAVDCMVKSGCHKINKILIVLESIDKPAAPCGLCRQKLVEFGDENLEIISVNVDIDNKIHSIYQFTLGELIPFNFNSSFLMLQ